MKQALRRKLKGHTTFITTSICLLSLLVQRFTFVKVETTNKNIFEAMEYVLSKLNEEKKKHTIWIWTRLRFVSH